LHIIIIIILKYIFADHRFEILFMYYPFIDTKLQESIVQANNTYLYGLLGRDITLITNYSSCQWEIKTMIYIFILENNSKNQ